MSDIAVRGNFDLAALNDLGTHLSNVRNAMSSASVEPYLRMGKDGLWIYGADSVEVEKKSQWAIHPLSVEHGWVCWNKEPTGQKKLGEQMVPFTQAKPPVAALPDHPGSPWSEQISFSMVCVSGEDTGTQTKFATASVGGTAEVKNNLLAALIRRVDAEKAKGPINADTSEIVPIVTLESSFYTHAKHGKIYTPIFNIARWGTLNDQAEKPAARNGAPAPEQEAPAEAPRRRTRQRAA